MNRYDIAIIGGSTGGVAAALAAAEAGARVLLAEAIDWLGGQLTSQGVSAPDEHQYIEQFGGTRSYYLLRENIRDHYRRRFRINDMPDGKPLNPGNGWVSRLCYEPRVGVALIEQMLAPHVAAGRLSILLEHAPVAATVEGDTVRSVRLLGPSGEVTVEARYFLDATDLGYLLPLTGTEYVSGAEGREATGESLAEPGGPRPSEVQSFTCCFAVEFCPGENHTIPRPPRYEELRDRQPFTLTLRGHHGEERPFSMFVAGPTGLPPFWTYRRLIDGALLDPTGKLRDVALINWNGNDYYGRSLIDVTPAERERAIAEAKELSLAFLHWLQTEVHRDDGAGQGYPELRLAREVMGTADGFAKAPYIRESRRIVALKTIVEGEIAAAGRDSARAVPFADSVGIGWYSIDLHPCVGRGDVSMFAPTLPFQIPLGALIPRRMTNLLAACKNIGTTHLTNGAYRLHPIEWNIGESAGALAAFCLRNDITPHQLHANQQDMLPAFQQELLARGVPLAWTIDVPLDSLHFARVQQSVLRGAIAPGSPRDRSLLWGEVAQGEEP